MSWARRPSTRRFARSSVSQGAITKRTGTPQEKFPSVLSPTARSIGSVRLIPLKEARRSARPAELEYHYDTPSSGRFFADAYLQYYKLDLFTNFTFFLDNPVNGDGINQQDQRYMYGGNLGYQHAGELFGIRTAATAGFQVRNDSISNIRLGTQTTRVPTGTIVQSAVDEASYSPYVKLELQPTAVDAVGRRSPCRLLHL